MMKRIKFIAAAALLISACPLLSANSYFSGFAGAKVNLGVEKKSSDSNDLNFKGKVEAYLSGQISFTKNLMLRGEFSVKTDDLIDTSIFSTATSTTDTLNSLFQIDEFSFIWRRTLLDSTNYLSAFVGTYEPIGSDVFLRRQFGVQPVASRLMENWLGLASSVIYPLFGIGVSDVIHFTSQPLAVGIYGYFNRQTDANWLNFDARFAGVYRFFTFDVDAGIGSPLRTSNQQDALLVIDTVKWRAGANLLIGNAYTSSLFIQGGVSDLGFGDNKGITTDGTELILENAYLIFEPRIKTSKFQLHIGIFNLPAATAKSNMFIDTMHHASKIYAETPSLGGNIDLFTETVFIKNHMFVFGIDSSITLPDTNIETIINLPENIISPFTTMDFNIVTTPYLSTKFNNGDLKAALQVNVTNFYDGNADYMGAFSLTICYKSQL